MVLGTSIVVIDSGRVLLARRADVPLWVLPGGGVEPREQVSEAAVRETREETGLEVELTRLVGVYFVPTWAPGGVHTVLFAARPIGGVLLEGTDGEMVDARYFPPDDLPYETPWWHRQRIEDVFDGHYQGVARVQDAAWITEADLEEARRRGEITEKLAALWLEP